MRESKGKAFRRLLELEPYVFTSGVATALDARIAEKVGLKAIYMSGYTASLTLLARADLGFPTQTEMAQLAEYIASSVEIPVIADADDGYGNALITMRTVEKFERAGVAGIHIEDQRAPKRCGHLAGKYVLPFDEAVGKYRAAVKAKSDPDFVIIARTDARGAVGGSLEDAIKRGRAYADAGADLIWPELGNPEPDDAIEFSEALRRTHPEVPLALNYSSSFKWHKASRKTTFRELAELNYRYIFITLGAPHAAMFAVWNWLEDLRDNEEQAQWRIEQLTEGHPTESHHVMGDFEKFQRLEEEFLPRELTEERYAGGEGFGVRGETAGVH